MDKLENSLQRMYRDADPFESKRLERAIIRTVAYADVFDFPLTTEEIFRRLVGLSASIDSIRSYVRSSNPNPNLLSYLGRYVTLTGREHLVETRLAGERIAAELWPQAIRYGNLIANLPYVRMVAVTGALAVNNANHRADIDYLIVTSPDRLWLCRAFVVLLVRWAALQETILCPNYFLSLRALDITPHSLYTAQEIAQMVPLSGPQTYRAMRRINNWTDDFLPNSRLNGSRFRKQPEKETQRQLYGQVIGERVFGNGFGSWCDRWEMDRKIRKFSRIYKSNEEVDYSPDWCKGHYSGHGKKTLQAYSERLMSLNIPDDESLWIR